MSKKKQKQKRAPAGSMGSKLIAHKLPNDQVKGTDLEAVRVVGNTRRSIVADSHADGSHDLTIEGSSPQCEEGTIKACRVLIECLNNSRLDGKWGAPIISTDVHVDCAAHDGKDDLRIQVTRVPDRTIWKTLGDEGAVRKEYARNVVLSEDLWTAVQKKKDKARADTVLAIDAQNTPNHSFNEVIKEFRKVHGVDAGHVGFKEIWVVGPTATLTYKLNL